MTGENVENVAKLLNDDRRYSCDEIAHELNISHGSVHRILTEHLQMRKIAAPQSCCLKVKNTNV